MLRVLFFFFPPLTLGLPLSLDLSHSLDNNTIYWPGGTRFRFSKVFTKGSIDDWYAANEFEAAEHGGTHLDAPYHFHPNGWQVGEIPLERFFGKAVYLNLKSKARDNPDYEVTSEDFADWEKEHGVMPEGTVVLLDFGWTEKYKNENEYFGAEDTNATTSFHFPGLSEDGSNWLVETVRVFGVGTDTASIDRGQSKDFMAHKILAKNNIYILEHVAFPYSGLPASGYKIFALPMKIRHGTGAPCRVLAIP